MVQYEESAPQQVRKRRYAGGSFSGEGHRTAAPQAQFTAPNSISAEDAKAASENNCAHFEELHPEFWPENRKLFLGASQGRKLTGTCAFAMPTLLLGPSKCRRAQDSAVLIYQLQAATLHL
jgi:hypothetical protein